MTKTLCRWPVIAAIIIASLIVLSIIWCLARCLCCGASCCCSCLRCLDCFTPNRHGRQREPRHQDDYTPMPINQGFQPIPSPMIYNNQPPQFATFDSPSGRIHEDSLPAMPSWDTAQKRRVEDESAVQAYGEDVEMERLGQPQPYQQRVGGNGYNQVPNGPATPALSPYDQSTEYFGAGAATATTSNRYNSGLGGQHLGNFQNTPLSPAPTYATNAPEYNAATDRFAPGFVSPSPEQYNRNYTHSPPQPHNFSTPYAPTISTRYEPSENEYQGQNVSPTQRRAPQAFGYPSLSPTSQQPPPSLLQAGRRPVNGSLREV
jgi:hypothetical protein